MTEPTYPEFADKAHQRALRYARSPSVEPVNAGLAGAAVVGVVLLVFGLFGGGGNVTTQGLTLVDNVHARTLGWTPRGCARHLVCPGRARAALGSFRRAQFEGP